MRVLGNSGGGDLGEVLAVFATGNHAFMRGPNCRLDQKTPDGLFSLDFPGSKGSHPGHSGILEGTPEKLDAGRFSPEDFQRLATLAVNGLIELSDVRRFIVGNLYRDPGSHSHCILKVQAQTSLDCPMPWRMQAASRSTAPQRHPYRYNRPLWFDPQRAW